MATVTIRGLVGEDRQITPERIAELYAELVAETAGPRDQWRSVVDVDPVERRCTRAPSAVADDAPCRACDARGQAPAMKPTRR